MIPALLLALVAAQPASDPLADLEAVERKLIALNEQTRALEARAEALATQSAADAARLTAADQSLKERHGRATKRLATWYRIKRRGLLRLVFDADGPTTLRRRTHYLKSLVEADERDARSLVEARDAARIASERVLADQRETAELRRDVDERRADLLRKRKARRRALLAVRDDPQALARLTTERGDPLQDAGPATDLTMAPDADTRFRALQGKLRAPVRGRIVRGYGAYIDGRSGQTLQSLGVDYAAPLGTPFVAVADGVVERAGYVRGFGQVVVVRHGSYSTLYAHANGLRVAQGQRVAMSEMLGTVGNTGLVVDDEARLHFEVRYNGTAQDPAEWLAK